MLEKTEGEIQRHWQHWVHKTQDENKPKKPNTTQTTKMMNYTEPTKKGVNPGACEGLSFTLYDVYFQELMLSVVIPVHTH
jgi:hypothetical protein